MILTQKKSRRVCQMASLCPTPLSQSCASYQPFGPKQQLQQQQQQQEEEEEEEEEEEKTWWACMVDVPALEPEDERME